MGTGQIKAENEYMTVAIQEAYTGIRNGHGGPFGSVIVKDGKIVGAGHNMVLQSNDSTAHGEISAIRNAEKSILLSSSAIGLAEVMERKYGIPYEPFMLREAAVREGSTPLRRKIWYQN